MQFKPRSFAQNCELPLPHNLNSIVDKGESFSLKKHDFSTTVGILKGSDFGLSRDLLVKRFNYRGFFDFVLHKLFHSRAKRLWKTSLRLYREGLSVPEPVAYEEASFKQRNSFFFSSVIEDAESLWSLYRRGLFT